MHRLMKKLWTAGTSALLTAAVLGGSAVSLQSAAAEEPKLFMSLAAGGSVLGICFTLQPPAGQSADAYSLQIAGQDCTLTDGKYSLCSEYAKDISKVYKVQIMKGSTKVGSEKSVSAADYLNRLLANEAQADYHTLAADMLRYGYAAKAYWDESDPDDPAVDCTDVNVEGSPFHADAVTAFNEALDVNGAPVTYYGMNLSLYGEIKYNLFFRRQSGKSFSDAKTYLSAATFGTENAVVTDNGDNFVRVELTVPASALTDTYTFQKGDVIAEFSPQQYLAAESGSSDNKLVNLCKALYAYGTEARAMAGAAGEQTGEELSDPAGPDVQTYSGALTSYNFKSGCAGLDDYLAKNVTEKGYGIAALTDEDYELYAGGWIEVTYGDKSMKCLVADAMPKQANDGKDSGDVDMDSNSFEALTGLKDTLVNVTWKPVPNPNDGNITLKFKSGSSRWWCAVQAENNRWPVASVKFGDVELERMREGTYGLSVNFYKLPDGVQLDDSGFYTFTLTDIFGHTVDITAEITLDPELGSDAFVPSAVQFAE